MAVMVRFENGTENRQSRAFGPFDFAQLTYCELRVGPDREMFAIFVAGRWSIVADPHHVSVAPSVTAADKEMSWSDVVIYALELIS